MTLAPTTTPPQTADGAAPDRPPRPRRRHRRLVLAVVLAAVVAAAAVLVVTAGGGGDDAAATTTRYRTVKAGVRTLTDSDRVQGTLGYADTHTIGAAASGTLTALPADGTTVRRGAALYTVDATPVVLLYGSVPMYRDLRDGVSDGADVRQLERNLEVLGYDPGDVDDEWTDDTTDAVEEWQDDLGVDDTGVVKRGSVVFESAALRVGRHSARVGDSVQPGSTLYSASSGTRVVTVDLDAGKSTLAVVGATATVTLPSGRTTPAKTTEVGSAATATADASGGNGGGSTEASADATIPVTLQLTRPRDVASLASAPVTVALTREQKKNVVTVPVTALVALAEGGYAVRLPDDSQPAGYRLGAVTLGMYAGGYVEVTRGLTNGQSVAVPS